MDKHIDILKQLLEWWLKKVRYEILPTDVKWYIYDRLKKDDK